MAGLAGCRVGLQIQLGYGMYIKKNSGIKRLSYMTGSGGLLAFVGGIPKSIEEVNFGKRDEDQT